MCLVSFIVLTVDGSQVPILGRHILHKCIKDKHQHSGRGLLLTIFTSVGKYFYAGQLREKTHPLVSVGTKQPLVHVVEALTKSIAFQSPSLFRGTP